MTELKRTVTLTVNGKQYSAEAEVRLTLADFIRHTLGLTGTHLGCEHGVCGACTILLDGRSARSCLMLAVQADGHEILTVEGIAPEWAAAAYRSLGEEGGRALVENSVPLYPRMARIFIQPAWVGILDFETRLPSAVERAIQRTTSVR